MLGAKRRASFRRLSVTLISPPTGSIKKPWPAFVLIVMLWLIWSYIDRFYGLMYPSTPRDITLLHRQASTKYKSLISRQSKTLEAAKIEYKRRYGMDTPPGYDAWFHYAKLKSSPIIDDFDGLMSDLKPFQAFQKENCDKISNRVTSGDIVRICIGNGNVDVDGWQKSVVQPILDVLQEFVKELPDLCITVNVLDQPRTVLSHTTLSNIYGPNPPSTCEVQHFREMQKQYIWLEATQSCSQDAPARTFQPHFAPGPPHVARDWTEATDICTRHQAPSSGVILCPDQMRLSNVVRPILSPATLASFHDIRIPSAKHFAATDILSSDRIPWSFKKPLLTWRGDSSNGWANMLNWQDLQRQHMVAYASAQYQPSKPPTPQSRKQTHPPRTSPPQEPQRSFREFLDFGFTNFTSCDPSTCASMQKELGNKDGHAAFDGKLVLSMDGHGADPDLYRLLLSNSAVVRQGMFREWHEDRLIPWYHYIPLSVDHDELPEMVRFFMGEGDGIARVIAEQGRIWAGRALRRDDMNIYIFRLMIEMGRREF